jgi:hydroxymethylglutaryl-CoA lyase
MMSSEDSTGSVEIMEVAPRDGFQSISAPLPTETKIGIIDRLLAAGCRRVEIGSFVSPRAVPQMADMGEISAHFRDRTQARLAALVPNTKGAEMALAHGIRELVYVFSASEAHNRENVRRSVGESIEGLRDVTAIIEGDPACRLRVDLATAFDCPFTGHVPLDAVRSALARIWEIAPKAEVALCDTTGRANPLDVRNRFSRVMRECPEPGISWAFHGHDTFGMGVANALFAYQCGVGVIDGSASGLGGCPFAPGATGNTATEDLVFAFEEAGIRTGIDLAALLSVSDSVAELPGACVGGHLRTVPRKRAVSAAAETGLA